MNLKEEFYGDMKRDNYNDQRHECLMRSDLGYFKYHSHYGAVLEQLEGLKKDCEHYDVSFQEMMLSVVVDA